MVWPRLIWAGATLIQHRLCDRTIHASSRLGPAIQNTQFLQEQHTQLMLANDNIIALVPITDAEKAKAFYTDKLGLKFVKDDGFALVMDANGIMLRLTKMREVNPPAFTVLGWEVADIKMTVRTLHDKGVVFERYHDFMKQDELGIWSAPDGTQVAWFKDPDGNTLSVTQHSNA